MPCTDWLSDYERHARDNFGDEWANAPRVVHTEISQPIASYEERQFRRAMLVLNEIQTGEPVNPQEFNSTDPRVEISTDLLNGVTQVLCQWFQTRLPNNIRDMSLEAQIWWRDHQLMDAERHAAEDKANRENNR